MEGNITNMLGALFWMVLAPFMIWKPDKVITQINNIYRKFSRLITPFPPKDSYFEFRPQTAFLARIIAVILFIISTVGFYLNFIEMIHKQ